MVKEDNLVPESFDYLDNQKSSLACRENAAMEKSVTQENSVPVIGQRFRGFLPVVVDVETAGFNAQTDALLEIACIPIVYDAQGQFVPGPAFHAHINPLKGLTSTAVR